MEEDSFGPAKGLIPETYLQQGLQALKARQNLVKTLLSNRKLPEEGWDDQSIEKLLQELALMDSNNFLRNSGVGEREGRVLSKLVYNRHFGLAHGMGRSGDISAVQPKAAGSSLLCKICNSLVKDAFEAAGLREVGYVTTVPVATGMAMTLVLLALKQKHPGKKYVLWPRIDQKTCVKCVLAANAELIVVENSLVGDQLETDLARVEEELRGEKQGDILCVLTTTSCFAPRSVDKVVEISKLCKQHEVPHIINNAYGIQCGEISAQVTSAWRKGRVDAVVQSTDKNFMVPVGGAVVIGRRGFSDIPKAVDKNYPGRASISPLVDVAITLLSLGSRGWRNLLEERAEMFQYLKVKLDAFAKQVGERVLETPGNPISYAMTLDRFHSETCKGSSEKTRFLGSMLFQRCVSGARVYSPGKEQTIGRLEFQNYGAHHSGYPHHYLNAAAAIGMTKEDVDLFVSKLSSCFQQMEKKERS
jgi:O-phospho-L-seryl-tRNASec:L-selenocysteinyl-tRNA synthase